MTMCFIRKLLVIITFFFTISLLAQKNLIGYFEPSVALNYEAATNYLHNFSISNRNYIYNEEAYLFKTRQIDLSHFSELKISSNKSISLGIQYRFRSNFEPDKTNELRLTQQYNFTSKPNKIRFGHRFRSEQRLQPSQTVFRFRYRFAVDLPLQGDKLDIGEAYLISSTECLLSVAKANTPSYDQRFSTQIGYKLSEVSKLQIGLEYRLEDYTNQLEHVLFLNSSLIFSL